MGRAALRALAPLLLLGLALAATAESDSPTAQAIRCAGRGRVEWVQASSAELALALDSLVTAARTPVTTQGEVRARSARPPFTVLVLADPASNVGDLRGRHLLKSLAAGSGGKGVAAARRSTSDLLAQIRHVRERMQALKKRDPVVYKQRLATMGTKLQLFIETGELPVKLAAHASASGHARAGGSAVASAASGSGDAASPISARFIAKVTQMFKATRAKLEALKESDPAAYSAEYGKLRPRLKTFVDTGVLPDWHTFRMARSTDPSLRANGVAPTSTSAHHTRAHAGGGRTARHLLGVPGHATGSTAALSRNAFKEQLRKHFITTRQQLVALKATNPAAYATAVKKLKPRLRVYVEGGVLPEFKQLTTRPARVRAKRGVMAPGSRAGAGGLGRMLGQQLMQRPVTAAERTKPVRRLSALAGAATRKLSPKHLAAHFSKTRARLSGLRKTNEAAYGTELKKLKPRLRAYVTTGAMPELTRQRRLLLAAAHAHAALRQQDVGNSLARRLAGCHQDPNACDDPAELLRRAIAALDGTCAVWIAERPAQSAAILAHALGMPAASLTAAAAAVSAATAALRPAAAPAEVLAAAASMDVQLYAHAVAKLEATHAELRA